MSSAVNDQDMVTVDPLTAETLLLVRVYGDSDLALMHTANSPR